METSPIAGKTVEELENDEKNPNGLLWKMSPTSGMFSADARQLQMELLEKDNSHKDDEVDDLTLEEEWRVVAMTIDRFLFLGFMAIFVVGTIACFANTKFIS